MQQSPEHQRFTLALDTLVEQVKADRAVVAAILCGSLSHDTVWSRSDIDLVLITADEKLADRRHLTLDAAGVHVHAMMLPRGEFRQTAEGARHNSFLHSFVAKGRLLFTHDPTIEELHARLKAIGGRDTMVQMLEAATTVVPCLDKARKWFVTRGDLDYTALWILYAATPLARLEVVSRGLLADREVIPQALQLNPDLFATIYTGLLNAKKTKAGVQAALETAERHLRAQAPRLFALVIDYLRDAGEARSCTEIEDHFRRHFDMQGITTACEYLAAEGLIGKASTPARLTRKSSVQVQELAFFDLGASDGRSRV
jgi:uncharacterized protein